MLLRGITFDAVGVLIEPRERVGDAYHRALREHDAPAAAATDAAQIARRYRRAYNTPAVFAGPDSSTRFHDAFWRGIVAASTGSASPRVFDHLYDYFAQPSAWRVLPGAVQALRRLRGAGLKTAVLSNNDARLRPLLDGLGLGALMDAVIVSAEVGAEKPSPVIFDRALAALGLPGSQVVHVGDDRLLDVWGARDAGLLALLMGQGGGCDVRSLPALADRLLKHQHHQHLEGERRVVDGGVGGGGGVPFYFMHDHEEDEEMEEEEEEQQEVVEGVC